MRLASLPCSAGALIALTLTLVSTGSSQHTDELICAKVFSYAHDHNLAGQPITRVIAEVAMQFLGSPYEAGTLDRGDDRRVVTNLRTFDCVTLVENVLALGRCIKQDTLSFAAYRRELERIRYRGGSCRGYASRLHYFNDWIADGESKGILKNITRDLGGRRTRKTIDFMSTHRNRYPHLGVDSALGSIRSAEAKLSETPYYVLPAARSREIPAGSIIAVAASVRGLDVSHTGIAVMGDDGEIHLLHAPDTGDSVKISVEPLARYLGTSRSKSGIIVVLPLDPF